MLSCQYFYPHHPLHIHAMHIPRCSCLVGSHILYSSEKCQKFSQLFPLPKQKVELLSGWPVMYSHQSSWATVSSECLTSTATGFLSQLQFHSIVLLNVQTIAKQSFLTPKSYCNHYMNQIFRLMLVNKHENLEFLILMISCLVCYVLIY